MLVLSTESPCVSLQLIHGPNKGSQSKESAEKGLALAWPLFFHSNHHQPWIHTVMAPAEWLARTYKFSYDAGTSKHASPSPEIEIEGAVAFG